MLQLLGEATPQQAHEYPTEREAKNVAAKPAATKQKQSLQITGANAKFPTLGMTRSADPVFNMAYVIHARAVTFKWKMFLLMLRGREARAPGTWKRPVRWLALMHGSEVSALWGHLGVASRELKGPKGAPMYK